MTGRRTFSRGVLALLVIASLPCGAQSTRPSTASGASEIKFNPAAPPDETVVRLTFVADDRKSLAAADRSGHTFAVKVRVADLVERLKAFHTGDVVKVWLVSDEGDLFLRHIEDLPTLSSRLERTLAIGVSFVLLLVLISVFYKGDAKGLIVGFDGRYSKSKFQMAVWFAALFASYAAAVYLRARYSHGLAWGGVNIPQNLLLISGLSALSFAGAKGITSSAVSRGVISKSQASPSFPADLLYADDSRPDFGDFQMLIVTALATFVYLGSVVTFLARMDLAANVTLPDVDTTILSAFGLGQGAYLAKKAFGTSAQNGSKVGSPVE